VVKYYKIVLRLEMTKEVSIMKRIITRIFRKDFPYKLILIISLILVCRVVPVNAGDTEYKAIFGAIAKGDLHAIQQLYSQYPYIFNNAGGALLAAAAEVGQPDVVLFFIQIGADVNYRDKEGGTPLHIAALWCDSKIIEDLCFNGARINAKNNEGNTPYYMLTVVINVLKMRNMSAGMRERNGVRRKVRLKECELCKRILRNHGGKMFAD